MPNPTPWHHSPEILERLKRHVEYRKLGHTLSMIADLEQVSYMTVRRDAARVLAKFHEEVGDEATELKLEAAAQYMTIIEEATRSYTNNPTPQWLDVILRAQRQLDNLLGLDSGQLKGTGSVTIKWTDVDLDDGS